MSATVERIAAFAALLRSNGFAVGLAETADAARVAASPLASRPASLREAWRALFCADAEQWDKFPALFDAFWLARGMRTASRSGGTSPNTGRTLRDISRAPGKGRDAAEEPERRAGDAEAADGEGRREGASRAESLGRTDFRHLTDPDRMAAAHAAAARIAAALQARLTRRECRAKAGRRLDLRRTIRASIPHGGVPLAPVWRRRRRRPLRIALLVDVSGSMSVYTAVFGRFAHGLVAHSRQAEVFLFHTRLVQVSDALRERDSQRAVDRLSLLAEGVGGGTRIGASLDVFNRQHARRALAGRSVAIVVSDGYDTGEPEMLGRALAALRHRCKRVVWLNPMLGWPGYEPRARGMASALPHIDLFAPAHNLEGLARLEPYLARL